MKMNRLLSLFILFAGLTCSTQALAFELSEGKVAEPNPAIVRVQQTNCQPFGGYPFSQNGCVYPSDLNKAFQENAGPLPPQNGKGAGAGQYSYWMDTSTGALAPTLRQCVNASGCNTTYTASDWFAWGVYNLNSIPNTFTLSANVAGGGGSVPTYVFVAPLGQSGVDVSLSAGTEFNTGTGVLLLNPFNSAAVVGSTETITTTGTQNIVANTTVWKPGSCIDTTLQLPSSPIDQEPHEIVNLGICPSNSMTVTGNGHTIGPTATGVVLNIAGSVRVKFLASAGSIWVPEQ